LCVHTYQCLTESSVDLPRGFSCDGSDDLNDRMLSHTRDICTVSLHCEFCCVREGRTTVQIVYYRRYIRTVSLPNVFAGVPSILDCFGNTFHIPGTGTCCCGCTGVSSGCGELRKFFRTGDRSTRSVQCGVYCVLINLLSW